MSAPLLESIEARLVAGWRRQPPALGLPRPERRRPRVRRAAGLPAALRAWLFRAPPAGQGAPPPRFPPPPIDARERSPWAPFSPRF